MEIKVSAGVNELMKEDYGILWKLHSKKTIIYLLGTFLIGAFLILIGLIANYDTSISSTRYDNNTTSVIKNVTYYKYHFTLGLGISFIIIALYISLILLNQRKRLMRSITRRKTSPSEYSIIIRESQINYEDPELHRIEKWSVFWAYKIYKKYILLLRNESYWESSVIPVDQIPQHEYEELLAFLKRNVPQKK